MNILIVGGVGYVGGAVTDILMQSKHNIRVYDSLLYEESYRKPVDFVYGDVRDTERLLPHLKWADAVIWLAGIVGDAACALNPEISATVNQESVKWLAENFDGKIVFPSTCSVYGAHKSILDESSPTNPLSVYAETKLAAEAYLEKKKNAIIFRLGTLFGVSDNYSRIRADLAVNTLTVRAYLEKKIVVFGGEQFRPVLHVRDAAQAMISSVETDHTGIFNLHNQNISIIDLAHQVCKHFPGLQIEVTPMKFEDARNYQVSSEKAKSILGFKPQLSIEQGIKELKTLLESGRIKNAGNIRYANHSFLSTFNPHKSIAGKVRT